MSKDLAVDENEGGTAELSNAKHLKYYQNMSMFMYLCNIPQSQTSTSNKHPPQNAMAQDSTDAKDAISGARAQILADFVSLYSCSLSSPTVESSMI